MASQSHHDSATRTLSSGDEGRKTTKNDEVDPKIGGLLALMGELKELLRFSRDVELKQLLDKIEACVHCILQKETQSKAGIQQLNKEQITLSSRLNSLSRELDLEQHPLATGDSRSSVPSEESVLHTLELERQTHASLRNHLDEFQTVLEQVRAENRNLTLRLSEYETEAIAARHQWLTTEAELKQTIDQLRTCVREREAMNVSLREEVNDAHQRAAVIVRDTHHFLGTVRSGLHKFVRELRGRQLDGVSADKCPSLREMLRLMKNSARNINSSSDGWMYHLDSSEKGSDSKHSTSSKLSSPSKLKYAMLTKKNLHSLDEEYRPFEETLLTSMACLVEAGSEQSGDCTISKDSDAEKTKQLRQKRNDILEKKHQQSQTPSMTQQVCLNSVQEQVSAKVKRSSPLKTFPEKVKSEPNFQVFRSSLPNIPSELDDTPTYSDFSVTTPSDATLSKDDTTARFEDEGLFRRHLEMLDYKLANLQMFMKQSS